VVYHHYSSSSKRILTKVEFYDFGSTSYSAVWYFGSANFQAGGSTDDFVLIQGAPDTDNNNQDYSQIRSRTYVDGSSTYGSTVTNALTDGDIAIFNICYASGIHAKYNVYKLPSYSNIYSDTITTVPSATLGYHMIWAFTDLSISYLSSTHQLKAYASRSPGYIDFRFDWWAEGKYTTTEPSWSSFGSEQPQSGWVNSPPTFSGWQPTGTGISLTPTANVTINDADGNSTIVDWYVSTDNSTWGNPSRHVASHTANTSDSYTISEATSYDTTYYIKVTANDGHDNSTIYWHFTTFSAISPSSGWQYVRQLNISDTGNNSANYQKKLRLYADDSTKDDPTNGTIDLAGHCMDFPDDIRFGTTNNSSTAEQLSQWIENITTTYVDIWVKLPSDGSNTIYLFAGNADADEYSDGDDTFNFFSDFSCISAYNFSKWDKVGSGNITKITTKQFTASHGGQGLATDGTYFYWGHNNGNGIDGTIYKIDTSGNEVTSFTGPPHCAGGDWRDDHNTLLFSSGGSETPEVWEINASTGSKIRSWDFTGEGYNRGALLAYKSENRIYLFTSDSSSNFKIKEYQINDNGTWSAIGTEYSHSSLGVPQGLDYIDGYLYYLYDTGISKFYRWNHRKRRADIFRWKLLLWK